MVSRRGDDTMSNRLWILGAPDAEMAAIEKLLTDAGERIAYATVDGCRVHPGNAYKAQGYRFSDGSSYSCRNGPVVLLDGPVVLVECGFSGGYVPSDVTVVDHHRPGDPGYGRPPEDFFAASSIGQVLAIIGEYNPCRECDGVAGWQTPDGRVWLIDRTEAGMIAAADHCLEAAYRGRCPGVDPDALMQWRVETRAAFRGRSVEEVMADVESARKMLREAPRHLLNWSDAPGQYWVDLRGYSIPELPEAAAREGIPFLATVKDRDGRTKVVLQAAGPELIRRFMGGQVVPGLVDYYGDPARGFAGGYQP